jgi:hypothetical protein
MRDPRRCAKLARQLGELWLAKVPDWRFGQLMSNFQSATRDDIFYIEDEEIVEKIKKFLENY